MNEPENNLASRPTDMNETCESLCRQVNMLFAALVITSFTLTAYLGVQARRASVELTGIKPHVAEADKVISQDDATIHSIYSKLEDFGRTHPDFQTKVLSKYKINPDAPGMPKK